MFQSESQALEGEDETVKEIPKIGKTQVGTSQMSSNSADAVFYDILALVAVKVMTHMILLVGTADPITKFMT